MIQIKMSSLGKIILKTVERFYPQQNLNLNAELIDNILLKVNIQKNNINKNELGKVISIIRNHIDNAIQREIEKENQIQETQQKIFKDMNADNTRLENLNLSYIDNFNKLREKDQFFQNKETDILPPQDRIDNLMEEKDVEISQILVIDSKDRNKTLYPEANNYVIYFESSGEGGIGIVEQSLSSVIEIELIEIYLKKNVMNFLEFPFLLLEIKEMGGLLKGTDKNLNSAVYRINLGDGRESNLCIKLDGECVKRFEIRKEIPQISIGIKTYDGEYYDFEEEKENQILNSFTFRITTQHKNLVSHFMKT